jgi:hypothetical protein
MYNFFMREPLNVSSTNWDDAERSIEKGGNFDDMEQLLQTKADALRTAWERLQGMKSFIDYVCSFYVGDDGMYSGDFDIPVCRQEVIDTTLFMIELSEKGIRCDIEWDTVDREFVRHTIEAKRNTAYVEELIETHTITGFANGVRINTAVLQYAKAYPVGQKTSIIENAR